MMFDQELRLEESGLTVMQESAEGIVGGLALKARTAQGD